MTKTDLAEMIVKSVIAHSESSGGTPLLFDALLQKDKDGLSLTDRNPHLAVEVAKAKTHAQHQLDQRIERESQQANFALMSVWDDQLQQGTPQTLQTIASQIGVGKLFSTYEQAMGFYKRQQTQLEKQRDLATTLAIVNSGTGFLSLTPEKQKEAADFITKPVVDSLHGMMNDPHQLENIKQAALSLANLHILKNLTVPNSALAGMMDGLSKIIADPSGNPTPRFLAAVEMYKAMPPNIQDMYVKDDTKQLLSSYILAVNNAVDSSSAYKGAYQGISPEAKKLAKERMESPEGKALISKAISKAIDTQNWIPHADFIPFVNQMPDNAGIATHLVQSTISTYLSTNPGASDDDIKTQVKNIINNNFIHDVGSNKLIGVPPGVGQSGKEAIKLATELLESKYRKETNPTLVHMGNGNYSVMRAPMGGMAAPVASMTWSQIQAQYAATHLTPEDHFQIKAMQKKAAAGSLTIQDANEVSPLASKLRILGQDDKLPLGAINRVHEAALQDAFKNIPTLSVGSSTNAVLPAAWKGDNPTIRKALVNELLSYTGPTFNNGPSGSEYKNFAAALIITGEGVSATAYDDPNRKAGKNIGAGFNFNAHSLENTKRYFAQAGINPGKIDDLKEGKASLTPDQIKNLVMVTLPTYTKKAKEAVEELYPRMWDNMTPYQRAVITDVAYQVGDVRQFRQSIQAMYSGDSDKISQAFKVKYSKDGKMVEDVRRNTIRAKALEGFGAFRAFVNNN
jgi:GH24 family phage-related lysozyme (muramidase)